MNTSPEHEQRLDTEQESGNEEDGDIPMDAKINVWGLGMKGLWMVDG